MERLQEELGREHGVFQTLDKALFYNDQNIRIRAEAKWKAAGEPPWQDLRFWGEALEEEIMGLDEKMAPPCLTKAVNACLEILNLYWPRLSVEEGQPNPASDTAREKRGEEAARRDLILANKDIDTPQEWLNMAEDFVALETTAYLSQFFVQLRNLAYALTWAPVLALLAVVSYPFHPQHLMLLIAGAIILVVAGVALYIFVQIEKDEVVSRIMKSTPRKLTFSPEFVSNIAVHILPVLAVLAAASTNVGDLVHALLDPIYQVLK